MRENRMYGSEGGAAQPNAPFLPLSKKTSLPFRVFSVFRGLKISAFKLRIERGSFYGCFYLLFLLTLGVGVLAVRCVIHRVKRTVAD